jgi:hypothetical protein
MNASSLVLENEHFCVLGNPQGKRFHVLAKALPANPHSPAYASLLLELDHVLPGPNTGPRAGAPLQLYVRSSEYALARGLLTAGCRHNAVDQDFGDVGADFLSFLAPKKPIHYVGRPEDTIAALRLVAEERLVSLVSQVSDDPLHAPEPRVHGGDNPAPVQRLASFDTSTVSGLSPDEIILLMERAASQCLRVQQDAMMDPTRGAAEQPSAGGVFGRRGVVVSLPRSPVCQGENAPCRIVHVGKDGKVVQPVETDQDFFSTFDLALRSQKIFAQCRHFFIPIFCLPDYCGRYGLRGQRFIHLECGALLQVFCTALDESGLRTRWLGGFDDHLLAHVLNLEPSEVVSCLVGVQ